MLHRIKLGFETYIKEDCLNTIESILMKKRISFEKVQSIQFDEFGCIKVKIGDRLIDDAQYILRKVPYNKARVPSDSCYYDSDMDWEFEKVEKRC